MSNFKSCQQCGTIHVEGTMCPHCFGKHPMQYSYPHHPLPFGDSRWFDREEVEYIIGQLQSKIEELQTIIHDNPILKDAVIKYQAEKYNVLESFAAEMKDVLEGLVCWNKSGHIDDSWWQAAKELIERDEWGNLKKLVEGEEK